jgi:hypothetical protein
MRAGLQAGKLAGGSWQLAVSGAEEPRGTLSGGLSHLRAGLGRAGDPMKKPVLYLHRDEGRWTAVHQGRPRLRDRAAPWRGWAANRFSG